MSRNGAGPYVRAEYEYERNMKAAIIGYGKMGREIERILHERGHEAALVIDTENAAELDAEHLRGIDVALVSPLRRPPTGISAPASNAAWRS